MGTCEIIPEVMVVDQETSVYLWGARKFFINCFSGHTSLTWGI